MKGPARRAAFVLLWIASLVAQSATPPKQVESHVRQLLTEGERLLAAGDINAALEEFRVAHSLAPNDVEAIIGLARAESQHTDNTGKIDMQAQALADYQSALTKQPTAELYTELGILFYEKNDYAAAIKAYKSALDLNPHFFGAELSYGNALATVGDFDDAISIYSKACVNSDSIHLGTTTSCGFEILADRGWAYFKKGDCPSLSLAEKDFSEAVPLEPGNADLHGRLADVLMAEGMEKSNCAHGKQERTAYLEHAWSELRIAVNLDSSNILTTAAFVAVSELLQRKPEYNGGIAKEPNKAELSQLVDEHHPELASTDSLKSLESLEDAQLSAEHDKALAAAKEAVRLKPTDGYAWYALGDAYMKLNDYASAEEPLKRALEAFFAAPPDVGVIQRGELSPAAQPSLQMAVNTEFALAEVCAKLHRKREAERYRRGALLIIDSVRTKQDR